MEYLATCPGQTFGRQLAKDPPTFAAQSLTSRVQKAASKRVRSLAGWIGRDGDNVANRPA
jgi:hypothetical protein